MPCFGLAKEASKLGIPLCVGSDAHFADEVGQHFERVRVKLVEMGVNELCYFEWKELKTYRIDW